VPELSGDDPVANAREHLAAGDPQAALSALRASMMDPSLGRDTERLRSALATFAKVARAFTRDRHLSSAVRSATKNLDDADRLYDLGYQFIEHGLADFAVPVLHRANARRSGDEGIVTELVCALEDGNRNAEAVAVLDGEPQLLQRSWLCRYLRVYNLVLAGDLTSARRAMHDNVLDDRALIGPDTLPPHHEFMRDRVTGYLSRAATLEAAHGGVLPDPALRSWQWVLSASVLVHVSPYGYGCAMQGRYAFVSDSETRIRSSIDRVAAVLRAWNAWPTRIVAAPDRDSQPTAVAFARILDLPLVAATPDVVRRPAGAPAEPDLVVAYDLAAVPTPLLEDLQQRRAGQIVFAHATSWTDPTPFVADITSLLYQTNTVPWGARLRVVDGQVEQVSADDAPSEALAERILTAPPADIDDDVDDETGATIDALDRLVAFAASVGSAVRGLHDADAPRLPLIEGPVKSSRFL